ncbi:uncharacterized protein LOC120353478 [Nilaparvata lugens]|uniref:uncharacterized protein LOC120353478 n=1 Tax=Nilaparvata lugens TaxID=108931 RepID=UPI00193D5672|nr:uncharacterized protein LOC120353478 [Nilaparvata lugens]
MPWVPFDYSVSPYYEMTRISVYITITMLYPMAVIRLSLMPVLILHVIGQFESISSRISQITSTSGSDIDENVIEIIKSHQEILMISKNLVEFFRPIILLKAIFSFWMFAVLMVVI